MRYEIIDNTVPVSMRFLGYPTYGEEWTVSPLGEEPKTFRSHEAARLFCNTLNPPARFRYKIITKEKGKP